MSTNKELMVHGKNIKNKINVHPIIEMGVTIVKILVLVTAIIVSITSLMAHARWYSIALRTGLAMLVVGFFGWIINWMISKWVIAYEIQKFEEENKASSAMDNW